MAKRLRARKGRNQIKKKNFSFFSSGSYFSNSRTPAEFRARYPYRNHAWVYAAATQVATVASQASFKVFRETNETLKAREILEKNFNRRWRGPRAGKDRTALLRYSRLSPENRIFKQSQSLMEDVSHPLTKLFQNPNPIQTRSAFELTTYLSSSLRGEFFWIKTGDNAAPIGPTTQATELWPISPDAMKEKLTAKGEFVCWEAILPRYFPSVNRKLRLEKYEVLHCVTRPDPLNPLRGMGPITAVALSVETDLLAKTHNRSLIENDAIPKGIIVNELGWADDDTTDGTSEDDFKAKWRDFYEGELKSGRIGFLEGSMKFLPIGMSPQDMQFLEQYKIDRQEVLSVIGVPPSGVGLSEFTNYSTALVQDSGFWNKTILPLLHAQEAAIDESMLFDETDDVVGLYDITNIEALRAGISDKIDMASKMCTDALHTPPIVAFNTVGLNVIRYEGDDKGFVSLALQKVEDALAAKPENEVEDTTEVDEVDEELETISEEDKKKIFSLVYKTLKENSEEVLKIHIAICRIFKLKISNSIFNHCNKLKDELSMREMILFSRRSVELFSKLKIGVEDG